MKSFAPHRVDEAFAFLGLDRIDIDWVWRSVARLKKDLDSPELKSTGGGTAQPAA